MNKKKLLFVCNCNLNRSPTFEHYFKQNLYDSYDVQSAGIYYNLVTLKQMKWADKVYVMDLIQKRELETKFPKYVSKIKVIGISDQYDTDSPELIELIKYWIIKEKIKC